MERAIGMSRDGEDDQIKGARLMDRRLIADPILTKHSISFIFEGTYHDKNAPVVGPDGETLPVERLGQESLPLYIIDNSSQEAV